MTIRSRAFTSLSTVTLLVQTAISSNSSAITVVIQPDANTGKDISLYERTDTELSSGKSLYVINTGPPGPGLDDFTSLIEFDLSMVPDATVTSATLWMYENNVPTFSFQHVSSSFPNTIVVKPVATSWEEGSVFFSTLPTPVSGYEALQTVDAVDMWFSWDVTNVVTDWLNGSLANNGFLIESTLEVRNGLIVVGATFDSSDEENAPLNAPYLEIELAIPGDSDGDGDVDGMDFLKWQLGETNAPLSPSDLSAWQSNYGFGLPEFGRVAVVPEPTSATLLLLLALSVGVRHQQPRLPGKHR